MNVDFKVEEVNPEWLGLATELMDGYTSSQQDYFNKWEQLLKLAETIPKIDKGNNNNHRNTKYNNGRNNHHNNYYPQWVNQHSPESNKKLLVISYENFLTQFPYCEQHWINFAQWKFKLGDTKGAGDVYAQALKFIPKSMLIWVNYLKFCEITVLEFDKLLLIYDDARVSVGLHYYSHLIYDTYLDFLRRHSKDNLYYSLLRRIIEIPLYHYSKYFKEFVRLIEDSDLKTIKLLITEDELKSIMKKTWSDLLRSSNTFKETRSDLRKRFIDVYITVQYHSYQIWQFEKKITRNYFSVEDLRKDELANWDSYIQYMENNNLLLSHKDSEVTVSKFNELSVKMIYERCLIATCQYPHFWIKYANWYLNMNDIKSAKEVLQRGIFVNPITNTKLRLRLIDVNLISNDLNEAKEVCLELCALLPNSLEPFLKLCQIVQLSSVKSASCDNLLDLITIKLEQVQDTRYESQFDFIFTEMLSFGNIPFQRLADFFESYTGTKKSFHFWKSYFDLYYLPTNENSKVAQIDEKLNEVRAMALLNIDPVEKPRLLKCLNNYGNSSPFAEFAH